MAETNVYFMRTPLDSTYQHTLYFKNRTEQENYFATKVVYSMLNCTYQRKDNKIRASKNYEELLSCNYVQFTNGGKKFYAFIKDVQYVSEGLTDVIIETDVLQTYMFDYQILTSFVEREHTDNDTAGSNTLPEGLELGEYVVNRYTKDRELYPSRWVVVGATERRNVDEKGNITFEPVIGGVFNGIYSGVRYYVYIDNPVNAEEAQYSITKALQDYADAGKIDAISSVFLAPAILLGSGTSEHLNMIQNSYSPYTKEFSLSIINTLDGYSPRNKKLLTDPYRYILVSNGNGGTAIYKYEYFNSEYKFKIYGSLTPGCSVRLLPLNYKGVTENETEGLNLGKYPQCNWATDQYTNWLTQNGVNIATSLINSTAGIGLGFAVGGPVGGVSGAIAGVSGIINTMHEVKMADRIPPQTQGNINCGDVVCSMKNNTFHYYQMSIKKEYAQIIDQYFDMFGYKTNSVKIPNKEHRTRYWYTKTIDVNIEGSLPENDLTKIKDCYNRGITFWSDHVNYRNYTLPNEIINKEA